MEKIDYRTLAYEKADKFLMDHVDEFPLSIADKIRFAFTMGYVEGHLDRIADVEKTFLKNIEDTEERPKYNEDQYER